MKVTVTSAITLTSKQVTSLTQAFKRKFPKESLQLEQLVNPKVLGGLKLNIGSKSLDASLKAKLETVKTGLYREL